MNTLYAPFLNISLYEPNFYLNLVIMTLFILTFIKDLK